MIARTPQIVSAVLDMLAVDCHNGNLRLLVQDRLGDSAVVRQADLDEALHTAVHAVRTAFGIPAHDAPAGLPPVPHGWDAIEPCEDLDMGDLFADDVTPPYDPDQTMFYA